MKKLVACSMAIILLFACSKKNDYMQPVEPILNGTWKFSQSKVSPGFPVDTWTLANTDTMYIEFAPNNVFRSNTYLFSNYTSFSVADSVTILLNGVSASPVPVKYMFEGPYLRLNPPCYEECSYRFVR